VNENDPVAREGLGDVIDAAQVQDCRLELRKQRGSGDVWMVTHGPLGTLAHPLMRAAGHANARSLEAHDPHIGVRSAGRYADWPRLRADEHVLVAFRARGNELEYAFLLGDGRPFGGGGGGLPTARRATALERARIWLSGRRASRVEIARYTGADEL
jgi:hypothetical protein